MNQAQVSACLLKEYVVSAHVQVPGHLSNGAKNTFHTKYQQELGITERNPWTPYSQWCIAMKAPLGNLAENVLKAKRKPTAAGLDG